jgi:hypothetical protein
VISLCDPRDLRSLAVLRHLTVLIQKLVGGPGFEPGASRSRTLRHPVQKPRERSISVPLFRVRHVSGPDL